MNDKDRPKAALVSDGEKLGNIVLHPIDSLDEIAHRVDGTFVVVVKSTGGKYHRRCYLSAASAERSAGRATARGESATVYLAELKPLWKLTGGGG